LRKSLSFPPEQQNSRRDPNCTRQHVAVGVVSVVLAGKRVVGHRRGVHGVVVGQGRPALVGQIADGVIAVDAGGLNLVGAERARGVDQPVQIVVLKRPAGGEQAVGDRGDVAVVVVGIGINSAGCRMSSGCSPESCSDRSRKERKSFLRFSPEIRLKASRSIGRQNV
jgi:hypothetical protein